MTTPSDYNNAICVSELGNDSNSMEQLSSTQCDEVQQHESNQQLAAVVTDDLEHRVRLVAEHLYIYDERAWFLAAMFNRDYYAATYALDDIAQEELFSHFLKTGIYQNHTPSPAFDPEFAESELNKHKEDFSDQKKCQKEPNHGSVFLRWLNEGFETIQPHALFDAEFYLDQYPDISGVATSSYAHFATNGLYENRIPCLFLKHKINSVNSSFGKMPADMFAIFSSIPSGFSRQFLKEETQFLLKQIFMPELYKKQLAIESDVSLENLYAHFLIRGSMYGHRPTVLFNQDWYLEKLAEYELNYDPKNTLNESKQPSEKMLKQLKVVGTCNPFFHWFFNGTQFDIIPTPLFDTDLYLFSHQDIRTNWPSHPFMHFIESGHKEPSRRFSAYFETNYYSRNVKKLEYNSGLLDYTLRGQFEDISTVSGMHLEHFPAENPISCSSLEHAAMYFNRRTAKLATGEIAKMIEKATALEPQLVRPYGPNLIRMAPLFHPEADIMHNMRDIAAELEKNQYDIIILIPHCRMAGSANVAGQFTNTLAELTQGEKILVITTDLSAFDRPDWFPENVDVYDLSKHTGTFQQQRKVNVLLDLVRGLRPKKLVNINSNLGWHLTNTYGKQLSAWMDIYFYLFCWDRDLKNNKGGYPIQWFLPTFNYCKSVFTDNTVLRSELQNRYCITEKQRNKIVTLHTPVAEKSINYINALSERINNKGVRRVFWSGRFDRQKRVDVLFAIANRLPNTEFWVWGKAVLNDSTVDLDDAPANVRFMGTYTSIDDLPIASCDCFLYTSGWDGLPIILIDVASRGIPIVASAVGGVVDLITEQSGWAVSDYANPDAYCTALNSLLEDYPAALQKAQIGRDHALSLCNAESYRDTLKEAMQLETVSAENTCLINAA